MKKNTIAILVATYNWPEALKKSLESILCQTVLPDEIIIADDGSDKNTEAVINDIKEKTSIPVTHLWQEDNGFRKTLILNKAVAHIKSDYIIQIDGDIVLDPHFIEDHTELMERGYYVCGSRVKLTEQSTLRVLQEGNFRISTKDMKMSFMLNTLRVGWLRKLMAERYGRKLDHLRGCNMAFWKSDFIAVNGYNEDLLQWGHEDGELILRMHNYGVKKKFLKFGGIAYHLWHKEASRANEQRHFDEIKNVTENKTIRCENGIDKYLKN